MIERRKYVRIPEDSPISYQVLPNFRSGDYLTRDISQGGIRFFIHEFVSKDSLLRIRLTLKKISFYFEAVVQVMWIREVAPGEKYEIGVSFTDIPPEASKHLIKYIEDVLVLNK